MNPAEVVRAACADGVRVTIIPPETVKMAGKAEALRRWEPQLRACKAALLRDARIERLRPSFDAVMVAFEAPADEIDLAWSVALADLDVAEVAFHASAALIRAGWSPLVEQAGAFLERAGAPQGSTGQGSTP